MKACTGRGEGNTPVTTACPKRRKLRDTPAARLYRCTTLLSVRVLHNKLTFHPSTPGTTSVGDDAFILPCASVAGGVQEVNFSRYDVSGLASRDTTAVYRTSLCSRTQVETWDLQQYRYDYYKGTTRDYHSAKNTSTGTAVLQKYVLCSLLVLLLLN